MPFIEVSYRAPILNVEFDHLLLSNCEKGLVRAPVLRLWEADDYFVVMGRSSPVSDVNCEWCEQKGIPIIRRASGGGTVVQGPGCLNYAIVLPVSSHPALMGIKSSYGFILSHIAEAISRRLGRRDIAVKGISDICAGEQKFSGNAQRRARRHILQHGTLLYDFDVSIIEGALSHPSKEPDYRRHRPHRDFVTNIKISRENLAGLLYNALISLCSELNKGGQYVVRHN